MTRAFIYLSLLLLMFGGCKTTQTLLPTLGVNELTEANFQSEVLDNEHISVVYFWAVWCGPCKTAGPTFKKIAKTEIGNTNYGKINVDESPDIAGLYGIRSIPTLLFFKNGEVVDRYVGVFSKGIVGEKVRAIQ